MFLKMFLSDLDSDASTNTVLSGVAHPLVELLSCVLQGQMGWVTVNFLVNYFTGGSGNEEQGNSCGALDWGGASSQITHQVSPLM
jgi:hypothetical protein